jgi:Rrf2 family transcriptional regulator, nitric oxide-sensitive transcriptional repressor
MHIAYSLSPAPGYGRYGLHSPAIGKGLDMRLTLHTDYSLRVLIYAGLKRDVLSTINEIAEHFDISKNHLMKVVHQLGQKGYIETTRGRKGGIRLLLQPDQINIGAVLRQTEDELGVLGCLQHPGYCRIEPQCILRQALRDATTAFLEVLDRYTLEDLLEPRTALSRLLAIEPPAVVAQGATA